MNIYQILMHVQMFIKKDSVRKIGKFCKSQSGQGIFKFYSGPSSILNPNDPKL